MDRFDFMEEDSYRLPEGFIRIGYDADSQRYQYRDESDGSYWEGPEGEVYGKLTQVGSASLSASASMGRSPSSKKGFSPSPRTPASPTSPPPTNFDAILGSMNEQPRPMFAGDTQKQPSRSRRGKSWKFAINCASGVTAFRSGPSRSKGPASESTTTHVKDTSSMSKSAAVQVEEIESPTGDNISEHFKF